MAVRACDGSAPPPTPTTQIYTMRIQPFIGGASMQPLHCCVAHTLRGNDCDALDSTWILQRSGGLHRGDANANSEQHSNRTIQKYTVGTRQRGDTTKPVERLWVRYGDRGPGPSKTESHDSPPSRHWQRLTNVLLKVIYNQGVTEVCSRGR